MLKIILSWGNHSHQDQLELIDWLDSFCFFLFLFIPPSFFPSPSPHSSRTCLSGTFLSQRVAHPFLCFQKCLHCSQEMTLRFFPSKTQGAVWEQRARGCGKLGPTPRPDLNWTSCGRGPASPSFSLSAPKLLPGTLRGKAWSHFLTAMEALLEAEKWVCYSLTEKSTT